MRHDEEVRRPYTEELLERLALAVRDQLRPRLAALEAVPLAGLRFDTLIEGLRGQYTVRARGLADLEDTDYAITDFAADRAWIWMHRAAFDELVREVARTRFSAAHELGHVVLHGAEELEGLDDRPEDDHAEELEREANRFAAHLLIPDQALKRLPTAGADALARRFGVSSAMAAKRIEEWRRAAR